MALLHYSEELRIAISDDPFSLSREEEIKDNFALVMSGEKSIRLQELNTYYLRCFYDNVPDFFSRFISSRWCNKYSDNVFEINFRNSVGKTYIGPLLVYVENKKIPEELYNSMLEYITEKYANLIFSFDLPLGQAYRKEKPGENIAYIEYLFLKKFLLDNSPDIDAIISLILANFHMKIYSDHRVTSINNISNFSSGTLLKTLQQTDRYTRITPEHPLLFTGLGKVLNAQNQKNIFLSHIYEEYRYHTKDTNENRFLKSLLKTLLGRLEDLAKKLPETSYLNPDIRANCERMYQKIKIFLNNSIWENVGEMSFIPVSSQILQRREGYRQLFSLYSLLQLCTLCDLNTDDLRNLLETKDTPTLFEYWSFFIIKDILDSTKKTLSCKSIISEDHLSQKVNIGICIQYEGGIELWFNRYFNGSTGLQSQNKISNDCYFQESYSHSLRPDIVLSKREKILIFDAKYKGQRGGFYGENEISGVITEPKEEDIDKMHAYRDAIRNVVGAFILYPGEKTVVYPAHNARMSYEGVGAFALKPQPGARPVRKHLDDIAWFISEFLRNN